MSSTLSMSWAESRAGQPGSLQRGPSWLGDQGPSLEGERVDAINRPCGSQLTLWKFSGEFCLSSGSLVQASTRTSGAQLG